MDKIRTQWLALFVASAVAMVSGCSDDAGSDSGGTAEQPAAADAAPTDGASSEVQNAGAEMPNELSAAHILIMHKGSERVPADVTRSKEEALALAQEITKKAKADGADFAALAKEHSEGPSGPRGGSLGNFAPDQMVKPFSDATLKLAIGQVSDPVETQFGYHIIQRQEVQVIPKASARHILVMYAGSERAPANITRTKEEAQARIQECLARTQKDEKFEALAQEYSDCPSARDGGDLGEFPEGVMHPKFDEATFACEVGKITGVVETPFGYHIIYRYK